MKFNANIRNAYTDFGPSMPESITTLEAAIEWTKSAPHQNVNSWECWLRPGFILALEDTEGWAGRTANELMPLTREVVRMVSAAGISPH